MEHQEQAISLPQNKIITSRQAAKLRYSFSTGEDWIWKIGKGAVI